jgi:hypothetical protein
MKFFMTGQEKGDLSGVALAPKKSPILNFCCQFSNIEAKLWFHFLSSRFLLIFASIHRNKLGNATRMD